ncbi:hypothetical protein [Nocardioides sp. Kera G14]|uniref:hypothetical protein n=1 Tax=Nocardioides sp. Kera G14 TaxID=2884264 RepID=UPI001D120BF8|nr:hypothetical protein [Nocardioides sp. Kera G14]UDY24686.1 hypothetical protein LH076_05115 [Nocardioides sp. Kera G14]
MNLDAVPRPLKVTVGVVALQAVALVFLAVLQLINLHGSRLAMGLTTSAFFVLVALALVACGWGLLRLSSIARSPVVLVELVNLGLAWSFRDTPAVCAVLALASVVALVGIFAPASLRALEPLA